MVDPSIQERGVPERVAVVGLGAMGHAMALNLHDRGYSVIGCDPSPLARSNVEHCIDVCPDISELGTVNAAVLSLPGADEVDSTTRWLADESDCPLVIDTSTSHPTTSRELAQLMRKLSRVFIDAPISGGKSLAREGLVSSFVGGYPEDVVVAAPVLDALTGGKWRHMGGPGSGNVTKLINNVMVATHLLVVAEAFSIGLEYGLDTHDLTEAIGTASGRSAAVEVNLPRWIINGSYDSAFAYRLMTRDASLAMNLAADLGLSVPVLTEVAKRWKGLESTLAPNDDFNLAVPAFLSETGCGQPIRYSIDGESGTT
jgi:3-hydroxyisobutyrate dehydrogenase